MLHPAGTSTPASEAYRLLHSCQYSGHLLKRSKWTIKWSFGLANLEAVRAGKRGNECRGEEHEVQVVRFTRSKKARVYWNGRNITHLFREANRKEDELTFAWQARSGERFQVTSKTHASATKKPDYEFFIDGRKFSSLPGVAELGAPQVREESRFPSEECYAENFEVSEIIEVNSLGYEVSETGSGSVPEEEDEHHQGVPADQTFRLSMVGLGPSEPVVDELHSDLYSQTIDKLRDQITLCIPETEEMVSRAVINAFFSEDEDSRSHTSFETLSDSLSDEFQTAIQFEADAISQAYEWLRLNRSFAHRPDHKDRKLEFLQKRIDAVMLEIRREQLTATEACQILFSVACVLGLAVNPPHEITVVVLTGLGKNASEKDLLSELKWYGEISAAAVSNDGDIGICRFAYPASVGLAAEASDRNEITIRGKTTVACGLLDAEKALCLSFLNMLEEDGFLRQNHDDELLPEEKCPSPQFMMAEFSPSAASNQKLLTVMVTPENETHTKHSGLRSKTSIGDRSDTCNRTLPTLATQDSEAGIYTPIRYPQGLDCK